MALVPTAYGDNPQQPFIGADVYVPDQLVAGNMKIVSDTAIISGAAALQRGSVMGLTAFGSASYSAGKAAASGTITIAALPVAADTLTVQGTVITFVAIPAGEIQAVPQPAQQFILGTTAAQAQALAEFLNASTDVNISKMTYSVSGSVITATSGIVGTGGNAYTLATSDTTAFTLSGATLSGGTNNTGTSTIGSMSLGPKTKAGNYSVVMSSSTAFTVYDPMGEELGTGVLGTAFVNPQINFTATTGGSPAANDAFVILATTAAAGVYKFCVASATDGSQTPTAILVDYTDPTGGNVNSGVYLMGEFNANALVFDPSLTPQSIKAAFQGRGIFIKQVVSADDPS
jgi:hypothetical protein